MKKCIAIVLCVCIFSMTAFALEAEPDYIAEYEAQYGKAPVATDFTSDAEYQAAYAVWFAGFESYVRRRSAEYNQQLTAERESAQEAAEDQPPAAPPQIVESAGSKNDVSSNYADTPVDSGLSDKYPVGSYVTPAGNVYAADGTLLSPGTTPAVLFAIMLFCLMKLLGGILK